MSRKFYAVLFGLIGILFVCGAYAGQKTDSVSGRYEGAAKSKSQGEIPVVMEIRLDGEKIGGTINTPFGDFPITDGSYTVGRIDVKFRAGNANGTITGEYTDDSITGSFSLGDDGGTISLKKTGTAAVISIPAGVPDVPALIREVALQESLRHKHIFEYGWTSKETRRDTDKNGKVKNETVKVFEVFPVKGNFAKKLISENGVALPPEQAAKEFKRLVANLEKAAKEETKQGENAASPQPKPAKTRDADSIPRFGTRHSFGSQNGFSKHNFHLSLWRFVRFGNFQFLGRERFHDRDAIVLSFRPRANYPQTDELQAPYSKFAGRVWIDVAAKAILRLEAWTDESQIPKETAPSSSDNSNTRNPAVVIEQTNLPDGMWLESLVRIYSMENPASFDDLRLNVTYEMSGFKHYDVNVEVTKPGEPKTQPDK